MNAQTKAKIDRTRGELDDEKNTMHPDTREDLHGLIDAAEMAANGIADAERVKAMSEAILALALIEVKKNIRQAGDMGKIVKEAVQVHVDGCPFGRGKAWHALVMKILPWLVIGVLGALQTGPKNSTINNVAKEISTAISAGVPTAVK